MLRYGGFLLNFKRNGCHFNLDLRPSISYGSTSSLKILMFGPKIECTISLKKLHETLRDIKAETEKQVHNNDIYQTLASQISDVQVRSEVGE
jgi:hypothetical protein